MFLYPPPVWTLLIFNPRAALLVDDVFKYSFFGKDREGSSYPLSSETGADQPGTAMTSSSNSDSYTFGFVAILVTFCYFDNQELVCILTLLQ